MILKMSEWMAYLPLIGFLNVILLKKRKKANSFSSRVLQAALLLTFVYVAGFLALILLGQYMDIVRVSYISKALRWNIHNIILFLVFMVVKIRNNRKNQQIMFAISIISCLFAIIQIVFYYYLFLSNPDGLTGDVIGIVTLCSMAILFIQGAILELMERNMNIQSRQNEEEKKLLEKKYEQDYYHLAMEQKEVVMKLREEMSCHLVEVQELIGQSVTEKEEVVQKLLSDMEERVNKTGRVTFCKDSVLNTILALKYARAEKEGLKMEVCVDSYVRTRVEDFDLCSVVTNLLDNAIEATKRVKESGIETMPMHVHIGHRGGYLIFKVENPSLGVLKKNEKGQYISSKREKTSLKKHGRGIAIVENVLEKYGGHLRFEECEGQMTVLAFLPSIEEKKDGGE